LNICGLNLIVILGEILSVQFFRKIFAATKNDEEKFNFSSLLLILEFEKGLLFQYPQNVRLYSLFFLECNSERKPNSW
jgi:hypothetical protein